MVDGGGEGQGWVRGLPVYAPAEPVCCAIHGTTIHPMPPVL